MKSFSFIFATAISMPLTFKIEIFGAIFNIVYYATFLLYVLCWKSVRYEAAIITSLSNKSSPK